MQSLPFCPPIIYGCAWKKSQTCPLVIQAVLAGFRAIDTACQPKHYYQKGVGDALRQLALEHGIERSQLFIQTKFTSLDGQDLSQPLPYDKNAVLEHQIRQSLETSLEELGVTYIDSLLMHSPMKTLASTLQVWRIFESFVDAGKVKHIGYSNLYQPNVLLPLIEQARIKPSFLQNRFYAATGHDKEILEICREHSIIYQSFWTLTANPDLLAHPSFIAISERHELTPAQTLFSFLAHRGITPLSGTSNQKHALEDVASVTSETLTEQDHKQIASLIWH